MSGFFFNIYQTILFNPINGLMLSLYKATGNNLAFAIILLTLVLKLILMPLEQKALKAQKEIAELQPKVTEIQKRYKDDQEKQATELMNLYKERNINPFASFTILLVQLPILITLYQVIKDVVVNPEINASFFGIISLKEASLPMAVLVAIVQYFQISFSMSKSQKKSQWWMAFLSPVLIFIILVKFPASIALYIMTASLITIVEQYFINKEYKEKNQKEV